jgi:hypothetical protein
MQPLGPDLLEKDTKEGSLYLLLKLIQKIAADFKQQGRAVFNQTVI